PSRSGSPPTAPPGCAARRSRTPSPRCGPGRAPRRRGPHPNPDGQRLHVLLTQLLPGGAPRQLDADTAARLLRSVRPRASGPRTLRRLAAELVTEIRHLDRRIAAATTEISTAVAASAT